MNGQITRSPEEAGSVKVASGRALSRRATRDVGADRHAPSGSERMDRKGEGMKTSRVRGMLATLVALSLVGAPSALAAGRGDGWEVAPVVASRPGLPEDQVPIPNSVAARIDHAKKALSAAERKVKAHRYGEAVDALGILERQGTKAHSAASAQIGLPPSDPEEDVPPGPSSVIAVLNLDHKVGVELVPLFRGMRSNKVVDALRATLKSIHAARDQLIGEVVGLDPEGDGSDYVDDMSDMVVSFKSEITSIRTALNQNRLLPTAHKALENALTRVQATQAAMNAAYGGGE